tara:strand:- start:4418 stop:4762 length:345 start_codon:yes stop_codon:yes gene_type:complete
MTETNLQEVLALVSDVYLVKPEHVITKCRIQPLPEARAVICYIAAKYKLGTQETVADFLNLKRSNVSQQVDKITDWRRIEPQLDYYLSRIEEYLDRPNIEPYYVMAAVLGGYNE